MIPSRVSLITIGVINLPVLRSFYKKLGWIETATSSDDYSVFETAGVLLSLFPLHELAKDAGIELQKDKSMISGIALAINVDTPDEVDQAITVVQAAGGRILREPSDAFWGGRTAYFLDPENNLWELAWNPSAVFDERGGMVSF